jgi:RND family efflux transporter MFP subunit
MLANNDKGSLLLKLGIALAVLVAIAFAVFSGVQKTALVKVAKVDTAVDAVTGSVSVDADGGTNKELKAEGEGKVIESDKIDEGERFKKGDVLLKLDATDLQRRIDDYKRNYENARYLSQIELTGGKPELVKDAHLLSETERTALYQKVNLNRRLADEALRKAKRMFELNNMSQEELNSITRNLENIDTQLRVRAFNDRKSETDYEVQLKTFEIEMERMQIKAPSDGEVVRTDIWNGALIGRGHVVAHFMSHERIVAAKISEESFGKVKIGQKAKVRLLTYGETSFDAEVSKMLPTADDAQRFTVYLDVKVKDQGMLKPRSTGEVTITVDRRPNATMIPRLALFDFDKVCVVKNGRVEKRQVEVGYVNLTEVEILKGVAAGEQVIVDAPQRFRSGDRVRVQVVP